MALADEPLYLIRCAGRVPAGVRSGWGEGAEAGPTLCVCDRSPAAVLERKDRTGSGWSRRLEARRGVEPGSRASRVWCSPAGLARRPPDRGVCGL